MSGDKWPKPVTWLIDDAWQAVDFAKLVRKRHARRSKRTNIQRQTDIRVAIRRLDECMKALRKALYKPKEYVIELRTVSEALQKERLKLWKMSQKRKRKN